MSLKPTQNSAVLSGDVRSSKDAALPLVLPLATNSLLPKKAPAKHAAVVDCVDQKFEMRLVSDPKEMEGLVDQWERLIETSIRKNPFFDPDFLIPALENVQQEHQDVALLLVTSGNKSNPSGPDLICGLMPVTRRRFYGLPVSCYEIWRHDQCSDCTPLLRQDCAKETLAFLMQHLRDQEGIKLLSMELVAGDGEFANVLTEVVFERKRGYFQRDQFTRASCRPSTDAETYLKKSTSRNFRKQARKARTWLEKQGRLTFAWSDHRSDPKQQVDAFLELESSGWKGQSATSLASSKAEERFFRSMANRAFANGKLSFLSVFLDGQPIAMLCDLHQGTHAIAYKTAYDESFSSGSPGVLAELENIERLHQTKTYVMDSCTVPNHPTMSRIWSEKMRFQSCVVGLGGPLASFVTALLPLIQWASKRLKRSE